jgi:hypothetical protein
MSGHEEKNVPIHVPEEAMERVLHLAETTRAFRGESVLHAGLLREHDGDNEVDVGKKKFDGKKISATSPDGKVRTPPTFKKGNVTLASLQSSAATSPTELKRKTDDDSTETTLNPYGYATEHETGSRTGNNPSVEEVTNAEERPGKRFRAMRRNSFVEYRGRGHMGVFHAMEEVRRTDRHRPVSLVNATFPPLATAVLPSSRAGSHRITDSTNASTTGKLPTDKTDAKSQKD